MTKFFDFWGLKSCKFLSTCFYAKCPSGWCARKRYYFCVFSYVFRWRRNGNIKRLTEICMPTEPNSRERVMKGCFKHLPNRYFNFMLFLLYFQMYGFTWVSRRLSKICRKHIMSEIKPSHETKFLKQNVKQTFIFQILQIFEFMFKYL